MQRKNDIRALSLFSGIGGFEVGMARCGFTFVKTLEWDEKCCETLNANKNLLGTVEDKIEPIDITKMEPEEFYKGTVDYIVGGPPCQSFSAAGRRAGGVAGTSDIRGTLFEYYCKYVNHFKPKAFVFENVRGILSSNKGADFKLIMESFKSVGYRLYWRILNAADYGAPQLRERVFLVGIRDDINVEFKFPLPTYGPDSPDKKRYITVGEAIADVQDDDEVVEPYGGKYGHLIPDIPPGENYRFYTEEMGHPNPLFAWRSKFSNFLYKMDPDDVCRTIIAYQGKYDGPFHWKNRKCTLEELKRMQGFPKEFVIEQTYTEGVKQIGNSVCPLVAEQIGKAIRYQIEGLDEYKVPLIENGQKLSFDKRKGIKAKKTRAKKIKQYEELQQISLFDLDSKNVIEYKNFKRERSSDNCKIIWNFKEGDLVVRISAGKARKKAATLKLVFFGSIVSFFKTITVNLFSDTWDEMMIKLMWDEVHSAVADLSTYDSLMPLYGHFTEPYPKFSIEFKTDYDSETIRFQKMSLDDKMLNKLLAYDIVSSDHAVANEVFKRIRDVGFDIRTNNTNSTIPEGYFRICYPFTMPDTLIRNIVWKDIK
jgi:DNA (cytosine-5)-methyltransferase 1